MYIILEEYHISNRVPSLYYSWTARIYRRDTWIMLVPAILLGNMFSFINLVRILNKLTKWKHSPIMMPVVFKSAPTLKRAMSVRQATFQLYVLSSLKCKPNSSADNGGKQIWSCLASYIRKLDIDSQVRRTTQANSYDFQILHNLSELT